MLNSPGPVRASSLAAGPSSPDVLHPAAISSPHSDSNPAVVTDPVLPEAVPSNADGFNWQEEDNSVDSLTDGMAALSVEPTGVGYLGTHYTPSNMFVPLTHERLNFRRGFSTMFT